MSKSVDHQIENDPLKRMLDPDPILENVFIELDYYEIILTYNTYFLVITPDMVDSNRFLFSWWWAVV